LHPDAWADLTNLRDTAAIASDYAYTEFDSREQTLLPVFDPMDESWFAVMFLPQQGEVWVLDPMGDAGAAASQGKVSIALGGFVSGPNRLLVSARLTSSLRCWKP
jgi:hypothetical protein